MKSKIYFCIQCGQECAIDEYDISNHITDDGIDYNADADHVALPELMETDPMKWKDTIDVKDD